jgi:hypothetical protein
MFTFILPLYLYVYVYDGPSGRAVSGIRLQRLACCDRWSESHRGHGCLLCVVRQKSLRRADDSSGGVLPTVARQCVFKKRLGRGHKPRWAALPEKIIIINLRNFLRSKNKRLYTISVLNVRQVPAPVILLLREVKKDHSQCTVH